MAKCLFLLASLSPRLKMTTAGSLQGSCGSSMAQARRLAGARLLACPASNNSSAPAGRGCGWRHCICSRSKLWLHCQVLPSTQQPETGDIGGGIELARMLLLQISQLLHLWVLAEQHLGDGVEIIGAGGACHGCGE